MSKFVFRLQVVFVIVVMVISQSECQCRYRNLEPDVSPAAFSYYADWGCYVYRNPDQFVSTPLVAERCTINDTYGELEVPGIWKQNSCYPFNHTDMVIRSYVASTFKYEVSMEEWASCCQSAFKCCQEVMMDDVRKAGHCPSVWDGWSCFTQAEADSTYEQVCSAYAYTSTPPRCFHYSYKYCRSNSTWETKTDYTHCSAANELIVRTKWHISTLTISILVCVPAAIVLLLNRSLINRKFSVTFSVIIAIIIRNFLVLLTKSIIVMNELVAEDDDTIMNENAWACKTLVFFEKLLGNVVFTCIFLEGIYLHQILTNVYKARRHGGPNMTGWYAAGTIVSVFCAIIWAVLMALHYDSFCWLVTEGTYLNWINDVPRLLMLLVNFALLLHILCTLWENFRSREEDRHPAIRTAKASLICLPLFGIPYIFVMVHPDTDSCDLEQFYYFVYYAVEALQGISIAVLHCYTEREVKRKIHSGVKEMASFFGFRARSPKISHQSDTSPTLTTVAGQIGDGHADGAFNTGFRSSIPTDYVRSDSPGHRTEEPQNDYLEVLKDSNQTPFKSNGHSHDDNSLLPTGWSPDGVILRNSSKDALNKTENDDKSL